MDVGAAAGIGGVTIGVAAAAGHALVTDRIAQRTLRTVVGRGLAFHASPGGCVADRRRRRCRAVGVDLTRAAPFRTVEPISAIWSIESRAVEAAVTTAPQEIVVETAAPATSANGHHHQRDEREKNGERDPRHG
ncbi:MAG: hypothetical protein NVSMB1_04710 [Polyangiales bacterium]